VCGLSRHSTVAFQASRSSLWELEVNCQKISSSCSAFSVTRNFQVARRIQSEFPNVPQVSLAEVQSDLQQCLHRERVQT